MRNASERKETYWSKNVGDHGVVVHASERADRNHVIVFRWSDPTRTGIDKRVRVTTDLRVRDDSGRVNPELERGVLAAAKAISHRLALGQPPLGETEADVAPAGALTLRAGFDLVLDPAKGKYHVADSARVSQVKAYADKVVAQRLLPATWDQHKRAHYVACWRALAREHKLDRSVSGPRHAEMLTDAVIASAKWLIAHEHLPDSTFIGWSGWRKELASLFKTLAPSLEPRSPSPRHRREELTALFGILGDPRVVLFQRLLPLVITDQRKEALASLSRSALDLGADSATLHLAWVRQRRDGTQKRHTRAVRLTGEGRELLVTALGTGHLQQLERDYQSAGIDFPLFPDGFENVDGIAPAPLCASSPNLLDLDPRLTFALELGGELRLGQVLDCTRRTLSLVATEVAPLGRFRVTGNDIKRGETVVLNARQHAAAVHALLTYLSLYERDFDADRPETDYQLFPSGQLARGVAVPPAQSRGTTKARTGGVWTATAARKQFWVLEAVANVKRLPGRGWYGIRRGITDVAPDHTQDPRHLDMGGAWKPGSNTRRATYQDQQSDRIRAEVSAMRDAIRGRQPQPDASLGQAAPAEPAPADVLALVAKLSPAERRRLVERLTEEK